MKLVFSLLAILAISSPAFAGRLSEGYGQLCYELSPMKAHPGLEAIEGMDTLYISGNFAVFQKFGDRKNKIAEDSFYRDVHAGYWGEATYYMIKGNGEQDYTNFLGIHVGNDPQDPEQKPYVKILIDGTVYELEPIKMLNCQTNF